MRKGTPVLLVLLITGLVWFAAQPTAATDIPYEWNNVPRVVAVGDIHGAYDSFVAVLGMISVGLAELQEYHLVARCRVPSPGCRRDLHLRRRHLGTDRVAGALLPFRHPSRFRHP